MGVVSTLALDNKDYVVVAKDFWQGVMDLAEDKADTIWAKKAIDIIEDTERFPHELVARLCSEEENPLKVWREYRGYTGIELAKKVGISSAYLSDIENGKKDGSIKVLKALAKALNVDIDDIV